ncbi:TPA: cell division inhibition protein DicB, partial [Escherichia coli]|nr:cell division inhibition protein DicB [Escherichia coli]HBD4158823.1 cell division inhibition protein DicB [Escherichia coli]HBD4309859.1 cell division inhibition protein DicB [Escherichia coli]
CIVSMLARLRLQPKGYAQ